MNKQERFEQVIRYFRREMPDARTELNYQSPFQLLVAVILSAQCTDERVNQVTPALFNAYPDAERMARAEAEELKQLIKSISYPNAKAKHLKGMAEMLMEKFHGTVPDDVEKLQELPGVGRKTANVIASVVFHQPAMAVDTHVFRVAARIGLSEHAKTPLETEKQLVAHIPREWIACAHHWLILHGRYVCTARKPHCDTCGISGACRFHQQKQAVGTDTSVSDQATGAGKAKQAAAGKAKHAKQKQAATGATSKKITV